MICAGIDSGIRRTKAVLVRDGEVIARSVCPTDWEPREAAGTALRGALAAASLERGDIQAVAVTGIGKDKTELPLAISGINAAVAGALVVCPECRSVIDLGAEGIRAVNIDDRGGVGNFAVNDKCASGAGAFLETMARIVDVPVQNLGTLALDRTESIGIDTQCVVFAESEVISLIHQQVSPPNIIHAIHQGLANKIGSIALRAGVREPLLMIGAAAANADLVECLEAKLGCSIEVPAEYEFVSALGAAAFAAREKTGETHGR